MLYDGDTFIRHDREFTVTFPRDDDHGAPWKEDDGHGIISQWTTRAKRPGERVLAVDHDQKMFYDFAATLKVALRDGWGVEGGMESTETKRQYAVRAVDADYEFCRGWAADEWQYVGVVVRCEDEEESIWGIESVSDDYLTETAHELADEIHSRLTDREEDAELADRHARSTEYGCTL